MGQSVSAAIPVTFSIPKASDQFEAKRRLKWLTANIPFDFFDKVKVKDSEGEVVYRLKTQLLLENFKDFFIQFHTAIGSADLPEYMKTFDSQYDNAVAQGDVKTFLSLLDGRYRGKGFGLPSYKENLASFFHPPLPIRCNTYIQFYMNLGKIILEDYVHLLDMQRLLLKAIDNPLARVAQVGVFG
jgi:hypothetical protein